MRLKDTVGKETYIAVLVIDGGTGAESDLCSEYYRSQGLDSVINLVVNQHSMHPVVGHECLEKALFFIDAKMACRVHFTGNYIKSSQ